MACVSLLCNIIHLDLIGEKLGSKSEFFFFLQEYDNEAETLVSGLQFNYDDEDVEVGKDEKIQTWRSVFKTS